VTPEEENDLRRRQAALSALYANPNWATFVAEAEAKEARLRKEAARIALATAGANQRRLDEIRGFIKALDWLTKTPEVAEANLARFMLEIEREGQRDAA
jgi:hypothetical protein